MRKLTYLAGLLIGHNTAIIHGLLPVCLKETTFLIYKLPIEVCTAEPKVQKCHRCSENHGAAGLSVLLLEAEHLGQRKRRADVGIQHKERLWIPRHNLVSEVIDAAPRSQRRILLQVPAAPGQKKTCVASSAHNFCRNVSHREPSSPDGNFKLLLSIEQESVQFFVWLIKADQEDLLQIWNLEKGSSASGWEV